MKKDGLTTRARANVVKQEKDHHQEQQQQQQQQLLFHQKKGSRTALANLTNTASTTTNSNNDNKDKKTVTKYHGETRRRRRMADKALDAVFRKRKRETETESEETTLGHKEKRLCRPTTTTKTTVELTEEEEQQVEPQSVNNNDNDNKKKNVVERKEQTYVTRSKHASKNSSSDSTAISSSLHSSASSMANTDATSTTIITRKTRDSRHKEKHSDNSDGSNNSNSRGNSISSQAPRRKRRPKSLSGKSRITKRLLQEEPWYGEGVCFKAGRDCPRGRNTVKLPPYVEDIDMRHFNDPLYCRTYVKDIYSYLRSLQHKYPINAEYLATVQSESKLDERLTDNMRSVLIDWLVEVAEEYMLLSDTLYLCVTYIDRVLSKRRVARQEIQLVGCTCLLIAAKYEEQFAPEIAEFVTISDNSFTKREMLNMEVSILETLDYRLTSSTIKQFIRRFQRASCTTGAEKHLSNYLAEISLLSCELACAPADMIAASSVFLARMTLFASDSGNEKFCFANDSVTFATDQDVWTNELLHYTGYTAEELAQIIRKLHSLHWNASGSHLKAIYAKYSLPVFQRVAQKIVPYQGRLMPAPGRKSYQLHSN